MTRTYVGALSCLALWACTGDDNGGDDSSITDDSGTVRDDSGTDDSGTDDSGTDDSGTDDSGTVPGATVEARLELVVGGLVAPTELVTLPWDSGHLYVVDQPGHVYRIDPSASKVALGDPWADLSPAIGALDPKYDERGLLGMAASSDKDMSGRVYFFHTMPADAWPSLPDGYDHENVVVEYQTKDDLTLDPGSVRSIWNDDHPYMNHNGGSMEFGADGHLYVSVGDGGNMNDIGLGHSEPLGNGQDRTNEQGSILRLDVGPDQLTYGIPSDNPLIGLEGAPEIWAYGFRNASGISFDPATGDLFAADAGQNMMEEVDRVEKGQNYGWNTKEGTLCFNEDDELAPLETCSDVDSYGVKLTDPILTFANTSSPILAKGEPSGITVIGGATYRGGEVSDLEDGDYVFGTYSQDWKAPSGQLFVGRSDSKSATGWTLHVVDLGKPDAGHFVRHVAAGPDGTIYVLVNDILGPDGDTGAVYRLVSAD